MEREVRKRSRRQDRTEAASKRERVVGSGEVCGRWVGEGQMERNKGEGKKAVVAPEPGCTPLVALTQLFWRC